MGYFQHKHSSIADAGIIKKCKNCNQEIELRSGNQKYCHRDENPQCDDDRHYQKLWDNGKHPLQKIEKNRN